MQRIIKGDKVRVISGKDKSKEGIVLSIEKNECAIVEGVNVQKRHEKPSQKNNDKGGIVSKECPIKLCKLALIDAKSKNGITRISYKIENDKKVRISKKSSTVFAKGGKK